MSALSKPGRIVFLAVLTLLLALVPPVGGVAEESPVFGRPPARGVVDLSGLETFMASEAEAPFQLRVEQSPSVQADSGSTVMDKALGLVGLPGMSGASDDESAYEKAWRMRGGPNGTTRLSYGERYRRNPDGSYGAQSSSKWDSANIGDRLLEQALSAGSGYFSSWAEGWLGGYGQARVSVRVNDEGDVTGSGDFLYPFYDSEHSTFFTQLGLRTMANDRVIGNFGLGQRFFPAENFALGYNVFLDQDFSRNHSRGGAGIEAWYDWLRLSANYYTPLSGWKDSKDYDSRLVEERPAEGYDARLTGYLPFYRNLAMTGAFEQWKGDHVGSFGSDDVLQKDPKVWSYGPEWTPVPAFSTSVNQRHSGGQKETQFWLTFNYHFGMDWEDQLSPALVTEMRTVDGSRHDFVNRQNEMILA
ncbi:MAG: inverse autotransporter beta domain-containing protein, partial [Candidatus Adiutrix sp.]|nr:inverse autotransporter beta domain-containing protein [Candidatus Adiutrix sp.]